MIPASYLYKNVYRQAWLDPAPDYTPKPAGHTHRGHPIRVSLRRLLARLTASLAGLRPAPGLADIARF